MENSDRIKENGNKMKEKEGLGTFFVCILASRPADGHRDGLTNEQANFRTDYLIVLLACFKTTFKCNLCWFCVHKMNLMSEDDF